MTERGSFELGRPKQTYLRVYIEFSLGGHLNAHRQAQCERSISVEVVDLCSPQRFKAWQNLKMKNNHGLHPTLAHLMRNTRTNMRAPWQQQPNLPQQPVGHLVVGGYNGRKTMTLIQVVVTKMLYHILDICFHTQSCKTNEVIFMSPLSNLCLTLGWLAKHM